MLGCRDQDLPRQFAPAFPFVSLGSFQYFGSRRAILARGQVQTRLLPRSFPFPPHGRVCAINQVGARSASRIEWKRDTLLSIQLRCADADDCEHARIRPRASDMLTML